MLVNNGDHEGLFRGAIMQSGGPIPVGDIDSPTAQEIYDTFVRNAACDNSPDTLECLRSIPYQRFKYAMDISPNFFAYQVCHASSAPVKYTTHQSNLAGACIVLDASR
jgi:acetylcholinesterase